LKDVEAAHAAAFINMPTPKLTRVLIAAVEQHAPPKTGLHRPKPRYAHQGGKNPPVIIIHGNALDGLQADYKRYLENSFRKVFNLHGTPLRIQVKSGTNPYEGKAHKPLSGSEANRMRREKRIRRKVYGSK
jgi:GTPase